jgi:hypothetical protein
VVRDGRSVAFSKLNHTGLIGLHRCKAGLGCSWISYRVFVGFLLVLEGEAVEAFAGLKWHGNLVDLVALCPSPKVVSLFDREADGDIVIRTIWLKNH